MSQKCIFQVQFDVLCLKLQTSRHIVDNPDVRQGYQGIDCENETKMHLETTNNLNTDKVSEHKYTGNNTYFPGNDPEVTQTIFCHIVRECQEMPYVTGKMEGYCSAKSYTKYMHKYR